MRPRPVRHRGAAITGGCIGQARAVTFKRLRIVGRATFAVKLYRPYDRIQQKTDATGETVLAAAGPGQRLAVVLVGRDRLLIDGNSILVNRKTGDGCGEAPAGAQRVAAADLTDRLGLVKGGQPGRECLAARVDFGGDEA